MKSLSEMTLGAATRPVKPHNERDFMRFATNSLRICFREMVSTHRDYNLVARVSVETSKQPLSGILFATLGGL